MGLIRRLHSVTARLARVKSAPAAGAGPILSVTFDDFPRSAWLEGAPIVEAAGGRATFYAAGRFCERSVEGVPHFTRQDLTWVHRAGHEVGCHTFSHKHASQISTAELQDDCARNFELLEAVLPGVPVRSFAYPYGDVSVRVKRAAAGLYETARGIRPGVNAGEIDLALLKALPLERRSWSASEMEALAAEAARAAGWLILFTHDVAEDPSPYGCTPAMLREALSIGARHGLALLPVSKAAERMLGRALKTAA